MKRVIRLSPNQIEILNNKIKEYWKQPPRPKLDINKLTEEMLKDPQYKDKVWIPLTNIQVAEHFDKINKCRLGIKDNGNGC